MAGCPTDNETIALWSRLVTVGRVAKATGFSAEWLVESLPASALEALGVILREIEKQNDG